MTTMPRIRPTYDPELQVIHRIFTSLGLLTPEARMRVMGYVAQRINSLPVIMMAVGNGRADDEQSLFPPDPDGDESAAGEA